MRIPKSSRNTIFSERCNAHIWQNWHQQKCFVVHLPTCLCNHLAIKLNFFIKWLIASKKNLSKHDFDFVRILCAALRVHFGCTSRLLLYFSLRGNKCFNAYLMTCSCISSLGRYQIISTNYFTCGGNGTFYWNKASINQGSLYTKTDEFPENFKAATIQSCF